MPNSAPHGRRCARADRCPPGRSPSPIKRNLNGDLFSLDELLAGIRAGLKNSSLERVRERAAERDAAGLEAEQLRQQRRHLSDAVPR